jgi:hypothetical protein
MKAETILNFYEDSHLEKMPLYFEARRFKKVLISVENHLHSAVKDKKEDSKRVRTAAVIFKAVSFRKIRPALFHK